MCDETGECHRDSLTSSLPMDRRGRRQRADDPQTPLLAVIADLERTAAERGGGAPPHVPDGRHPAPPPHGGRAGLRGSDWVGLGQGKVAGC